MAIAVDQASLGGDFASDTTGTTVAFTTTNSVSAGGFIVVTVTCIHSSTELLSSVSGGGLTWTVDKTASGGSASAVGIASAQAPSGLAASTTITATLTASSGGARSICGTSFVGVAPTSPVDGTPDNHSNALGTAWTSNSVTIRPGSLIVACAMNTTNLFTSTPTAPSVEAHDFGSGGFSQTTCYRIEPDGGSFTVAGTWSSSANSDTVSVAYLAAPATNSIPPPLIMAPYISV